MQDRRADAPRQVNDDPSAGETGSSVEARPPQTLHNTAVDKLISLLDHMVAQADGKYEVTVDMLQRRDRCKACTKTISRALHSRRVYVRRLRAKPTPTTDDIPL
jgi:hypothetical protein